MRAQRRGAAGGAQGGGGEEGLIASFSVLDKVQTNITYLLNENVVLGPLSIVGVRAVPVRNHPPSH